MADGPKKKSSHDPMVTEKHKKARMARCALAAKKGKKAGHKSCPTDPTWEIHKQVAKRQCAHDRAVQAIQSLPASVTKGRVIPDPPYTPGAREMLRSIREIPSKGEGQEKPETKAAPKKG